MAIWVGLLGALDLPDPGLHKLYLEHPEPDCRYNLIPGR